MKTETTVIISSFHERPTGYLPTRVYTVLVHDAVHYDDKSWIAFACVRERLDQSGHGYESSGTGQSARVARDRAGLAAVGMMLHKLSGDVCSDRGLPRGGAMPAVRFDVVFE